MEQPPDRWAEAAMAIFAIVVGAVFATAARALPGSRFEPIGSGAVPAGVAWIAIALGLVILGHVILRSRRPAPADTPGTPAEPETAEDRTSGWPHALAISVATLVYVWILWTGWLFYGVATFLFLVSAILLLARDPRAALVPTLLSASVVAAGLDVTFRYVLIADIP